MIRFTLNDGNERRASWRIIALINLCQRGDIVVTQDYGVAALTLGKGEKAIHQSGRWYTDENIDDLLMGRHMAKVARRKSKNHLKGPAKRTEADDRRFEESFRQLIENCESEYRKDATKP